MAMPELLLQQLLALDDDGMSDVERAKLHAALQRSIEQFERGETVSADEVVRELRAKRAARAAR